MNQKSLIQLTLAAFAAATLSGCYAMIPEYGSGLLYRDASFPVAATANRVGDKVGTATVTSILGLITTGDASIEAAARNGGITHISHVDYHTTQVLGIYSTYTVYVYGY